MYINNIAQKSTPFTIIQSNQMEKLLDYFVKNLYENKDIYSNIFDEFNVIVPSKVMGEWLKKQIADRCGISTLITTEFWGRYYWDLLKRVSKTYAYAYDYFSPNHKNILEVPEVAMLSKNVMQWRIFSYFFQNQANILADKNHALHYLLEPLLIDNQQIEKTVYPSFLNNDMLDDVNHQSLEQSFWLLAGEMATMLNRYMTYRENWLMLWGKNQAVSVKKMIEEKDNLQGILYKNMDKTPDWLLEYYEKLEQAQRFLWFSLFKEDFNYRKQLREQFWQAFSDKNPKIAEMCKNQLPKRIVLFTIQQLPPSEFEDLKRLSEFVPVILLHFNPSEQFWADIVDKNWLTERQLTDPNTVYLKDYGHTLLSRFGKQSREVFAMLADLSGNDYEKVEWIDDFAINPDDTLLANLQNDILMLDESDTKTKIRAMLKSDARQKHEFAEYESQKIKEKIALSNRLDTSLAIHACHSMVRQLEVLRTLLIGWLNKTDNPNDNEPRLLSDILVLVPDLEAQRNVIEAIFPKGVGADGFELPAKITGVIAKEVSEFWQAVMGYYTLLNQAGARFSRKAVFDWLMLPKLYESFGLNAEQMSRACELLAQAGFERGFDERHLQQSLSKYDDDYRCTFAYALERLVAGLWMPHAKAVKFGDFVNQYGQTETIDPLPTIKMSDKSIISVLCQIYQTLHDRRDLAKVSKSVEEWLIEIESLMQQHFAIFNQTNAWKSIFSAQNELKQHLKASQDEKQAQLPLKLPFILQSIAKQIQLQQVSSEPSGMITFARIGAVRNLPYKLVVMLNLNLADFPQREVNNRYNLMQAGLSKRGDRFREDDDLGAFLDAILCAKQACWLFYNGKSNTDSHEHLPASPVQELLDFLSHNVDNKQDNFGEKLQNYLITEHHALPFDKQYFEISPDNLLQNQKSQYYPPANTWFEMYQNLYKNDKTQQIAKINLWSERDLVNWLKNWQQQQNILNQQLKQDFDRDTQYLSLYSLINNLQNPAKAFLDFQNIFVWKSEQKHQDNEALTLDSLKKYQLRQQFVHAMLKMDSENFAQGDSFKLYDDLQQLVNLNDILPVGANRYPSFVQIMEQTKQGLQNFMAVLQNIDKENLQKQRADLDFSPLLNLLKHQSDSTLKQLLTDSKEQHFVVSAYALDENSALGSATDFMLKAVLPDDLHTPYWIDYHATSGKEKYQLAFWLSHLGWQVARQTTAEQAQKQDGFSLWHYQEKTLYLPAIAWQTAYQYLQNYLILSQFSQRNLTILPPATTLSYLTNDNDDKKTDKKPSEKIKNWINTPFNTTMPTVENFEFEQWQALIGDKKPSVILRFLNTLGNWAYAPLQQNLIQISEQK